MKLFRDRSFYRLSFIIFVGIFCTTVFFLDNDTRLIRDLISYFNGNGYYTSIEELFWGFGFIHHIDSLITWTFAPYQFVMIPLITIAGVILYSRLHSVFQYECTKYHSRKEFFFKKSFLYSAGVSVALFMTYLIFLIFALIFLRIDYESNIVYRSLFVDVLGIDLYFSHREIFYILEGTTRFLFVPFIYSFLSCATAFYVKKKYLAYFTPLFLWFGFMAVGYLFYYIFPDINQYFSPNLIMATSSYEVNTFFVFLPHLIVFSISVYLILRASRKYEF